MANSNITIHQTMLQSKECRCKRAPKKKSQHALYISSANLHGKEQLQRHATDENDNSPEGGESDCILNINKEDFKLLMVLMTGHYKLVAYSLTRSCAVSNCGLKYIYLKNTCS